MNESGGSAGPARGSLKSPLDRVVLLHDEIDLPFGEVQARLGGGLAGHNGLKSLGRGFGAPDFWRVRAGVGRPDSSDPEIVSAHVLGRFSEPREEVAALIARLEDVGSDQRKAGGPPIKRAVANLLSSLWHRVTRDDMDEATMHEIAAILDEAAQKIERLK